MASPKQLRKIAIVGGSGNMGGAVLSALLALGHQVTAITRAESSSTFPEAVKVHRGSLDDAAFLESALAGQDVLVMIVNFAAYDSQIPLIRAAAKAGVPYVVPTEFGSDSANDELCANIDLVAVKRPYRALIEELGVSSWIGVVNNPWFDYLMKIGFHGIDLKQRTVQLLDDGTFRANTTTIPRVGESLAGLLSLPEAELARYKNAFAYFSSFAVSQRDILESAMRVTGTKESDWTFKEPKSSKPSIQALQEQIRNGNGMAKHPLLFYLTWSDGYGGNYQDKVIDYSKLGLKQEENLDDVVRRLVKELGA